MTNSFDFSTLRSVSKIIGEDILTHKQINEQFQNAGLIYLKNGSIIRGIIIEQIPNQSLKIQTKDRNVFVFKYDEILKITKEYLPTDELQNSSNSKSYKKSGFINLTEINYCPGIGDITDNHWEKMNQFFLDYLPKFESAIRPFIKNLK